MTRNLPQILLTQVLGTHDISNILSNVAYNAASNVTFNIDFDAVVAVAVAVASDAAPDSAKEETQERKEKVIFIVGPCSHKFVIVYKFSWRCVVQGVGTSFSSTHLPI